MTAIFSNFGLAYKELIDLGNEIKIALSESIEFSQSSVFDHQNMIAIIRALGNYFASELVLNADQRAALSFFLNQLNPGNRKCSYRFIRSNIFYDSSGF